MASHIERRKFLATLGGGAVAWPIAARAQQTGKVYRIGYLGVTSYAGYAREIEALLRGLRRLGYEEGKNIAIVYPDLGKEKGQSCQVPTGTGNARHKP
jgi:hypothetical protein